MSLPSITLGDQAASGKPFTGGGPLDSGCVELELVGFTLEVVADERFAALLHPIDGNGPTKALGAGAASLLRVVADGPTPVEYQGTWVRSDVAALVLDGVLSLHADGRTLRGPAAVNDLFPGLTSAPDRGPLGRASERALGRAAVRVDQRRLGELLYRYGRLPVGDAELQALSDRANVARWLGIDSAPVWLAPWRQRGLRDAGWWNLWNLRDGTRVIDRSVAVPKLYVSPRPADLPDALRELAIAAAEVEIPAIKVGSDAHAVYRPDKLVAYAADVAQLDALAVRLLPRLSGMTAHGVPFTAERSEDGLLSWGADPAVDETNGVRESWREHVTSVAAEGLRRATGAGVGPGTAVTMARAWLWINDIDPHTWAPAAAS